MSNQTSDNNKRIAKNTLLLYLRMLFMMLVSLYTSRVILNTLGVVDFGINNVVGGVITMLGFLTGSLGAASSRYITFDLGKGDMGVMKRTFGNIKSIHYILAGIILLVGETIGLWFMTTQLQIPAERETAAFWVYQFSILSAMIAVISVYGVAWMAETYFGAYIPQFKTTLSGIVVAYPWTYAFVLFLISKLVNSQAAALAIVVPMGLSVGVDPLIILSFVPACYAYFILPTYPSDLACIGFDRSGTTRIGKFVINHSFILPGCIGVFTSCVVGYFIAHAMF